MFLLKVFVLIAATASVAFAQANAKVSGTVTDPNGAAVSGRGSETDKSGHEDRG